MPDTRADDARPRSPTTSPSRDVEAAKPATSKLGPTPRSTPIFSNDGLGIEPVPDSGNDPSLGVEWQAVDLGSGTSSCACTITGPSAHTLTVTIDQPPYKKTVSGTGVLTIAAIPVGSPGTDGRMIIRDDNGSASAEFTWTWRRGGAGATSKVKGAKGISALVKRVATLAFGRNPTSTAAARAADGASDARTANGFDGEWHSIGPFDSFSIRIDGNLGIMTSTNAAATCFGMIF